MKKGQKHSLESRQKIKNAKKKERRIFQFTLNGDFIKSYPSYREAGAELGKDPKNAKNILVAANPNDPTRKSAFGYRWSFINRLPRNCRPLTSDESHQLYIRNLKLLTKEYKNNVKNRK